MRKITKPKARRGYLSVRQREQLKNAVRSAVAKNNKQCAVQRQVSIYSAITVANRHLATTRKQSADARLFGALRAVNAFLSLATHANFSTASRANTDLLPVGHPYSTRKHALTASALRSERAQWIAADAYIESSLRALVASVYATQRGSVNRVFGVLKLQEHTKVLPRYITLGDGDALTAGLLGLGGNSSAARRARVKLQRRDRKGRFAEMGGGFSFNVNLGGGRFASVSGRVVGAIGDADDIEIEVRGRDDIPDGIYTVASSKGLAVRAILQDKSYDSDRDTKDSSKDAVTLLPGRAAPASFKEVSKNEYKTEDGYKVTKDEEQGTLRVQREVGDGFDKTVKSWADVQKAIIADTKDYQKYLDSPEGQQELSKGKYNVVDREDGSPVKAKLPRTPGEQKVNDISDDAPVIDQVTKAIGNDESIRFTYDGKYTATLSPRRTFANKKNGNVNVEGVDSKGQIKTYTLSKMTAPSLTEDTQEARLPDAANGKTVLHRGDDLFIENGVDYDKTNEQLQRMANEVVDAKTPEIKSRANEMYPGIENEGTPAMRRQSEWYAKVQAEKDKVFAEEMDLLKKKREWQREQTGRTTETADSDGVVDLIDGREDKQVAEAIENNSKVRFVYNDKERVFAPKKVYRNPKNNQVNIVGLMDDGTERTFAFDKMMGKAAPEPEPAVDATPPSTDAVDISDILDKHKKMPKTSYDEISKAAKYLEYELYKLQKENKRAKFIYKGKERDVEITDPGQYGSKYARAEGNAKLVGFDRNAGGERSFFYNEIEPLSPSAVIPDDGKEPKWADLAEEAAGGSPRKLADFLIEEMGFDAAHPYVKDLMKEKDGSYESVMEYIDQVDAEEASVDGYDDDGNFVESDDKPIESWAPSNERDNFLEQTSGYNIGNIDGDEYEAYIDNLDDNDSYSPDEKKAIARAFDERQEKIAAAKKEIKDEDDKYEEIEKIVNGYFAKIADILGYDNDEIQRVFSKDKATEDDKRLQNVIDDVKKLFDDLDSGAIDGSEVLDRLGDAIDDVPNNDQIYNDLKKQVENMVLRNGTVEKAKLEAEKSIKKKATEEGAVPYLSDDKEPLWEDLAREASDNNPKKLADFLIDEMGFDEDHPYVKNLRSERDGAYESVMEYIAQVDEEEKEAPDNVVPDDDSEGPPKGTPTPDAPTLDGMPIDGYLDSESREPRALPNKRPQIKNDFPNGAITRILDRFYDKDGNLNNEGKIQNAIRLGLDGLDIEDMRTAIERAIDDNNKQISFTYHEKSRTVQPIEIWTNPKNGKVNLRGIDAEGNEKNFTLEKIGKPLDEGLKQANADDIINMQPEELADVVDALWPASEAPEAPEVPAATNMRRVLTRPSAAVDRVEYDADTEELFIQFKTKDGKGGGVYRYDNVDSAFVDKLDEAKSIGKMIPELKKNYSGTKIDAYPEDKKAPDAARLQELDEVFAIPPSVLRSASDDELTNIMYEVLGAYMDKNLPWTYLNAKHGIEEEDFRDPNDYKQEFPEGGDLSEAISTLSRKDKLDYLIAEHNYLMGPDFDPYAKAGPTYDAIKGDEPKERTWEDLATEAADGSPKKLADFIMEQMGFDEDHPYITALRSERDGAYDTVMEYIAQVDTEDRNMKSNREMDEALIEEFDSIYEVPPNSHKVNIFDEYVPQGRVDDNSSADFTDDPEVLSNMFTEQELARGLIRAVRPNDDTNEPASGFGELEFAEGSELVPAEAIYAALDRKGVDVEKMLAQIYDAALTESDNPSTNLERLNQSRADIAKLDDVGDNALPYTDEIKKAQKLNATVASRADRLVSLIDDYDEKNPKIISLAEDLKQRQATDIGFDDLALEEMLDKYLPLSVGTEVDKEAFRAFWGMLFSLDGGFSDDPVTSSSLADKQAFRTRVFRALEKLDIGEDAQVLYDQLLDEFGSYPDFVRGKDAIANGDSDLNDPDNTAAAFTRLVRASAQVTDRPLWRSIGVAPGSQLLQKYKTPGQRIAIDPRSYTTDDLTENTPASLLKYPAEAGMRRVIFEMYAGDGKAVAADNFSWFDGENEWINDAGTYEVISVRTIPQGSGKATADVIQIRQVMPTTQDDLDAEPDDLFDNSTIDVSGWRQIGGQGGSNPGGTFVDENGNEYYVKVGRSQSHAENEVLAGAFYERLGVSAARTKLGDKDGETRIVSPMIPGATADLGSKRSDPEYVKKLQDGFVVDAWLSNWDVVGLVYDNVVTDSEGNPVRVDHGGALTYRARGKEKGAAFSNDVNEIDTFRDPDLNPQSADIFGNVTDEQIISQVKQLAELQPEEIDAIVRSLISDKAEADKLSKQLIARQKYLVDRYLGPSAPDANVDLIGRTPELVTATQPIPTKDLQAGDVTNDGSFVIQRVFTDENTPKGKMSVEGYYPGRQLQRKEWNTETNIDVARGGPVPDMGDAPPLHRPTKPRAPSSGAFTGLMAEKLKSAKTWEEAKQIIYETEIVYFDYETTGFASDEEPDNLNNPLQLGAVRIKGGKVVERFNVYMNPETPMGNFSRNNLKRMDGELLTDEWLAQQISMLDAHTQFLEFVGENPILGGQYIPFDIEVLQRTLRNKGLTLNIGGTIDSKDIAKGTLPAYTKKNPDGPRTINAKGEIKGSNSLGPIAEYLNVELNNWHRADADAEASWQVTDAMLTRAIETNASVDLIDASELERQAAAKEQYEKDYAEYKDLLAKYTMDKAVGAAWVCNSSGATTASIGPEGPCSVPSVDELVKAATPKETDSIDPADVPIGSTSDPASYIDEPELEINEVTSTEASESSNEGIDFVNAAIDDLDDYAETEQTENGLELKTLQKKQYSSYVEKLRDLLARVRSGEISPAEASDLADELAEGIKVKNNDDPADLFFDTVKETIRDIAKAFKGTLYDDMGSEHPPKDIRDGSKDGKGPGGVDRDGKIVRVGMRVRDKWGFAGTVVRYNKTNWRGVWIRMDIDVNGVYAPGAGQLQKNPNTLTVINEGDDDSPFVDGFRGFTIPANKRAAVDNAIANPGTKQAGPELKAKTEAAKQAARDAKAAARAAAREEKEKEKAAKAKAKEEKEAEIQAQKEAKAKGKVEKKPPKDEAPEGAPVTSPDDIEDFSRWEAAKPVEDVGKFLKKVESSIQNSESGPYLKFVEKHQYVISDDDKYNVDAAVYYLGGGSEEINAYLSGIESAMEKDGSGYAGNPKRMDQAIRTLDKLITIMPKLKNDTVVYRGVSRRRENDPLMDALGNLKPGDTFFNTSYTSTAFAKEVADAFVGEDDDDGVNGYLLEIVLPKDTRGLFSDAVNYRGADNDEIYDDIGSDDSDIETELILPRDSTFQVLSRDGKNIKLVLIPKSKAKALEKTPDAPEKVEVPLEAPQEIEVPFTEADNVPTAKAEPLPLVTKELVDEATESLDESAAENQSKYPIAKGKFSLLMHKYANGISMTAEEKKLLSDNFMDIVDDTKADLLDKWKTLALDAHILARQNWSIMHAWAPNEFTVPGEKTEIGVDGIQWYHTDKKISDDGVSVIEFTATYLDTTIDKNQVEQVAQSYLDTIDALKKYASSLEDAAQTDQKALDKYNEAEMAANRLSKYVDTLASTRPSFGAAIQNIKDKRSGQSPTGAPPVKVETPASWDAPGVNDTLSLEGARSRANSDIDYAGVLGAAALIDSGDIEDFDMHVHSYIDGSPSNPQDTDQQVERFTYKLTPWAGQALAAKIIEQIKKDDTTLNKTWTDAANNDLTVEVKETHATKTDTVHITTEDLGLYIERVVIKNGRGYTSVPRGEYGVTELFDSGWNSESKSVMHGYANTTGITYRHRTEDGIRIEVHRSVKDASYEVSNERNGDKSNPSAFNNTVQITAPRGTSTERIAEVMSQFGGVADARPTTDEDVKVLKENRLISVLGGKSSNGWKNIGDPVKRQEALDKIKKEYGITVDDLQMSQAATGRNRLSFSSEIAAKLANIMNIDYFVHSTDINFAKVENQKDLENMVSEIVSEFPQPPTSNNEEDQDAWARYSQEPSVGVSRQLIQNALIVASYINGPFNGLLSSTKRWTSGAGSAGQSSNTDVQTGGAEYVFTTPRRWTGVASRSAGASQANFIIDPAIALQRLDFYANRQDSYGRRQQDADIVANARITNDSVGSGNPYEVMFKHDIPLDAVEYVQVSEEMRPWLIDILRRYGVTEVNGKSVDDFVVDKVPAKRRYSGTQQRTEEAIAYAQAAEQKVTNVTKAVSEDATRTNQTIEYEDKTDEDAEFGNPTSFYKRVNKALNRHAILNGKEGEVSNLAGGPKLPEYVRNDPGSYSVVPVMVSKEYWKSNNDQQDYKMIIKVINKDAKDAVPVYYLISNKMFSHDPIEITTKVLNDSTSNSGKTLQEFLKEAAASGFVFKKKE